MTEKGRLYIIAAPSGTGKGTVIEHLLRLCPNLVLSISATTRAPREGEEEGRSYYFVSRERFEKMIRCDEFLEYAEYVGELYGTPKKPVEEHLEDGKDVLLEIEVQGAMQVMALVTDVVTIFIVPPSLKELEHRLRNRRTDSEENLIKRLAIARSELKEAVHFSHIIINDDVTRAAEEIRSIIE